MIFAWRSMMSRHFENVSIIGAGISGAALAIELTRYGIIATIYEGRDPGFNEGGSIVLCANACRALDRLGVYSTIREAGSVSEEGNLRDIHGNKLGTIILGSEKEFGYPAVRTWRNLLRTTLLKKATELGVKIVYSKRLVSIEDETEDFAVMLFSNGEKIRTDLVVGANGIYSNIRNYFNPGSEAQYTGQTVIFGFAKTEDIKGKDEDKSDRMILDKTGSFAYLAANAANDTVLLFSTIEIPDRPREEWRALMEDKRKLKDMLQTPFSEAPWPETVRGLVAETPAEVFSCWPFDTVPDVNYLSRWGRVIIIGDAAHAIPPSMGQGGAMALEDGCTLGIVIRHVNMNMITEGGLAAMDLLRRWEGHRKTRVARVADRTKMGSTLRKATVSDDAQAKKERGIRDDTNEKNLEWLYGYDVEDVEKVLVL